IVDPGIIETCLHKTRMFVLAQQVGVTVEPYAAVTSAGDLHRAATNVGFPCIVRPIGSGPERFSDGRKAVVIPSPQALRDQFNDWPAEQPELLIQHYAPGPRHGIYFAARRGRILARLEVISERTDRADGTGFAVEGTTAAPDPALQRYADALVDRL